MNNAGSRAAAHTQAHMPTNTLNPLLMSLSGSLQQPTAMWVAVCLSVCLSVCAAMQSWTVSKSLNVEWINLRFEFIHLFQLSCYSFTSLVWRFKELTQLYTVNRIVWVVSPTYCSWDVLTLRVPRVFFFLSVSLNTHVDVNVCNITKSKSHILD